MARLTIPSLRRAAQSLDKKRLAKTKAAIAREAQVSASQLNRVFQTHPYLVAELGIVLPVSQETRGERIASSFGGFGEKRTPVLSWLSVRLAERNEKARGMANSEGV